MLAWPLLLAALAAALVRHYRLHTFLLALVGLLDLLVSVKRRARQVQTEEPNWTMADALVNAFEKYWEREFVVVAGRDEIDEKGKEGGGQGNDADGRGGMTYGECEMASSAVAGYMTSPAVDGRPGDIVAILMPSGCEFVAALFGLMRCGVRAALVNTCLRGNSLVHCLVAALEGEGALKAVLVSPGLRHVLESLREAGQLSESIAVIEVGAGRQLDPWSNSRRFLYLGLPTHQKQLQRWDATCLYVYTSGTTGFPKASKMNHLRIWSGGCVGAKVGRLGRDERLYCPLPLYHASGLTLGLGACLQRGCTVVVRPVFSVRRWSHDVLTHGCTSVQYIGEMARYLVAAPPSPLDSKVRLRFALGNGMPPEVWAAFQKRYGVELVHEFYASTEGNVNVVNNTGLGRGACGIVPPGLGWIYPIGIYKYDTESDELVRDPKTGLCVPAAPNEPGELLGLMKESDPTRRFDGYADGRATQKKIVNDVRTPGDRYFRSGDLMKKDRCGFLYFCDRVGETFRWKGENVSTSEVARVLLGCRGEGVGGNSTASAAEGDELRFFAETVVYGVEVRGNPGRAGMATVLLNPNDGRSDNNGWQESVWRALQSELPRYAQPLFIRVAAEIEKTGTQKYKKNHLQKESFLDCGSDDVYFRDDAAERFVMMDDKLIEEVLTGERRV